MGTKNKRYIKGDGGKTMKSREDISLRRALGLILMVLTVLLFQVPAQGATNCSTVINSVTYPDKDCDGITDTEETPATAIPQCGSGACNPDSEDLFVILMKCGDQYYPYQSTCPNPTNLPSNLDPLGILSTAASALGITVHQIDPLQTCCNGTGHIVVPACCALGDNCGAVTACTLNNRNVTPTQMAVRILEKTDTNGTDLGVTTPPGTPDTAGDAVVFTQRIKNFVHGLCNCTAPDNCPTTCYDALDQTQGEANVIAKFMRHTIAHEAGHAMTLRAVSSTDIGEHYPQQTNVLLDSSVYYTQSKGVTKFYIGSGYYTCTSHCKYGPPNDKDSATLR